MIDNYGPRKPSLFRKTSWVLLLIPVGLFLWRFPAAAFGSGAVMAPSATIDDSPTGGGLRKAVIAGGCFWGVQGVYQHVNGVTLAQSGYAGGEAATANYETVSTGTTGHAESVEITYDPKIVTYGQLLQIYFSVVADPTELNKQGPDHGTQYRSTLFFQNGDQKKIAQAYVAQLGQAKLFRNPIVTTLEPFKAFYKAEDYHQDFLTENPTYPYIAINDMPKVENLKRLFPALYREQPVLVMH